MRVAISHAQINRITCRELAHRQVYLCLAVYGERRDNEQASACESVGMADGRAREIINLILIFYTF